MRAWSSPPAAPRHGRDAASSLLELVRDMAEESHPGNARARPVTLGSDLERDLGLGSLALVELVARVERAFGVALPGDTIARISTPRDLLALIGNASDAAPPRTHRARVEAQDAHDTETPDQADTLVAALQWHARRHPDRVHILLEGEEGGGGRTPITYGALLQDARAVAHALRKLRLETGDTVALLLPTCAEYFPTFLGIVLAGGVPVPLYPPLRASQIEDHLRRHVGILRSAGARVLVSVPETRRVARQLRAHVETLRAVVTPEELRADVTPEELATELLPTVAPDDIALLQYTSGSTGAPKGVIVTHSALLANLRAMTEIADVVPSDVFVSWLPLYHDMGLIGAWLGSLVVGFRLVLMSPLSFLSRPLRWLTTIHEHRATLTAAPNFAFALCLARITDEEAEGLDLNSLRMMFNGAEPVSPDTVRAFVARFARHGLRTGAMAPVYGLAEACLGLTFSPVGRGPVVDRVHRQSLLRSGHAEPAGADDPDALSFVACGRVIPGHEIRVVDASGDELRERHQGHVQFRGPSATPGYYRNDEATRRLVRGGWLETGDLGYVAAGDLYVTGRVKDVIIRAGRNVHPHELEEAVGRLDGVRTGCVAVFGGRDARSGTEHVVVLAETRESDPDTREQLRRRIQESSVELLGMPADDIVLAPPRTVLKTSSGKIRRAACEELYERRALGRSQRPVWLQIARIVGAGAVPRGRRLLRKAATYAYSAYAWAVLACVTPAVWLGVLLLPRLRRRRALCRGGARLIVWLTRLPLEVEGAERLPRTPCVVVVNHASYADTLLLHAALPIDAAFVAKSELRERALSRLPLDRVGAAYVTRSESHRGIADTLGIAQRVRDGETLVLFPEGTFTPEPGLRPFHMGAFVVAAETGVPVVPIAIRGARGVNRGREWLVRRRPVRVTIGQPLVPESTDWEAAVRLRDAARAALAADCGEPELVRATDPPPAG